MSKKEHDLVPTVTKPLALTGDEPATGTEHLGEGDTALPRLKLLQNTSTEVREGGRQAGTLLHTATGEEFAQVEFIPVIVLPSRIMFDSQNRGGAPLCRSVTLGDTAHGTSCPGLADGSCSCENLCANCIYRQFRPGKGNRPEPPPCSLMYNYVAVLLRDGGLSDEISPVVISMMRTSADAARSMNYTLQLSLSRDKATGKVVRLPVWAFVWELSSIKKSFVKGQAHVFQVRKVRPTTEEERRLAQALYASVSRRPKLEIEEPEAQEQVLES